MCIIFFIASSQIAQFNIYGFLAQILGIVVAFTMLMRTLRKDTEERFASKASVTELNRVTDEVNKKANKTEFELLKSNIDKQMDINEKSHKEIREMVFERINLVDKNLSERITDLNVNLSKRLDVIIALLPGKIKENKE